MMSHREVRPDHDEATGGSIGRVVTELRAPVPVRAEWRAGLLRGIAMLPAPGATDAAHVAKRWSLRPVTAIAAGIVCAIVGATLAAALLGRSRSGGSGDVL